eukprot:1152261-Pelagomonas_calceolata.AAC.2
MSRSMTALIELSTWLHMETACPDQPCLLEKHRGAQDRGAQDFCVGYVSPSMKSKMNGGYVPMSDTRQWRAQDECNV